VQEIVVVVERNGPRIERAFHHLERGAERACRAERALRAAGGSETEQAAAGDDGHARMVRRPRGTWDGPRAVQADPRVVRASYAAAVALGCPNSRGVHRWPSTASPRVGPATADRTG